MKRRIAVLAAFAALTVLSVPPVSQAAPPSGGAVVIQQFRYLPGDDDLAVATRLPRGTLLNVYNAEIDGAPHTLTHVGCKISAGACKFDSGTVSAQDIAGIEGTDVLTPGTTYSFYCKFHAAMSGKVAIV